MTIRVASIVKPKDGQKNPLRSGASVYGAAICVSVDPFILVSKELDMVWSDLDINLYYHFMHYEYDMQPYFTKANGFYTPGQVFFAEDGGPISDDYASTVRRGRQRRSKERSDNGMPPREVYQMCVHGALIVGSQAKRMMGENVSYADWDLLCPNELWQTVALVIPPTATMNKFGGWRFFTDDGEEVDVWPDNLQAYLTKCKSRHGGPTYAVDFINNKFYCSGILP